MSDLLSTETDRLAKIAAGWSSKTGLNSRFVTYSHRSLKPFFRGRTCLELGSADGQMTQHLLADFERIVAVDGSQKFIDSLNAWGAPNLFPKCALFEELESQIEEKFSTVVCAHILEHVADPVSVMRLARACCAPGGVILLDVPHAHSFHRLAAVKMGLLREPTELNSTDHMLGHRRVYTWKTFLDDIAAAGLHVQAQGGSFLKTLSNAQMEASYTEPMLDAFYELGRAFPANAAEIWAVCEPAA